ncbi:hypothetical protein RHD99_03850 [Buttiauxella selenatireducens]|uniref:PepSY domain-containing protein n=1 Tax=Buttiauxella selenatireducens TaxID=3073902 RepID=A0ABY9SC89_9ENTR|nr:hypothetical protein [Buttiauxella sp. R73]WMY75123.1 hypothetical protein RHD99_03850 [Buttiauxella sp. R73]
MKRKNITLVLTLCMSGLYFHNAFAISDAYRAQLENSGCTQVSEANGTCNSEDTNQYDTSDDSSETRHHHHHHRADSDAADDVARGIDRHIAGKYQGQAVDYMEDQGWESLNDERTRWRKAGFIADFDINQNSGQVMGVSVH